VYDYAKKDFHSGPWLIMMYAPWCAHCKKFQKVYEELAAENHGKLNFGRVDCTADENDDLCESFDVEGYPSIYILI
jgi:thioredoxin-like negative regulator of GroEL